MMDRRSFRNQPVAWLTLSCALAIPLNARASTRPFSQFEGLQGVIVYDLTEDETGVIWLGTENGVWRCESNSFQLVSAPTGRGNPAIVPPGWGHGSISVVADRRGVLWIGTGGGVMGLDVETLEPVAAPAPLDRASVPRLRFVRPGFVYACSEQGLYEIIHDDAGVRTRLLPDTSKARVEDAVHWNGSLWIAFENMLVERTATGDRLHAEVPVQGRATRLFVDSNDRLWVGMRKQPGLLRRDGDSWTRFGPEQGLLNDEINCIAEDKSKTLWIGTERGLFQRIEDRFFEIGYREGLGNTDVHAIAFDREGLAWIGTFGGGAYLMRSGVIVHYGPEDGIQYPFVEFLERDANGNVYVGTLRGMFRFSPATERAEVVLREPVKARHIALNPAGDWWIDTGDGIRSSASKELIPVGTVVECMGTAPNGRVYVGGSGGLFELNGTSVTPVELPPESGGRVRSLIFAHDGAPHAGTERGLAWKRDRVWHFLPTEQPIVALAETTDGTICAGTTDSILMLSTRERKVVRRFAQTGRVHTIVVSPERRHVWAGTDNGIVRVEENRLPRITMEDGLPSRDVRGLAFMSEDRLLVGTTNGVARLDIDRLRYSETKPRIEIDLWSINGPQRRGRRDALHADLNDQALVADIRAIGRRSIVGIEYRYRIVELHEHWSDWTRESRIRLPRLPAGSYTVAALGRNAEGTLSDMAEARLVIVPPFYASGAFLSSASGASIVCCGAAIWLVRKRREYRRRIEASERRYRSLVESIRVIPWEADPSEGRFVYVGPQTKHLVGHAPDDWQRADFLPKQVPGEDLAVVKRAISRRNGDGGPEIVEHRLRAANGEIRWFKNIVSPGDETNGRRLLQGLMVDITAEKRMEATERAIRDELESAVALRTTELEQANEALRKQIRERERVDAALRESEERFARAFHASPVAMVLTRLRDNTCLDANDAFFAMTGYARADVVGKQTAATEMWPAPRDRQRMLDTLRAEGRVDNMELEFRRRDGEVRTGRLSVSRVELNAEPCIISIAEDITDQKRAERELVKAQRQLVMLIASSPAVTYSCGSGPDHPTTFISDKVFDMMGYRPRQFYRDARFWADRIHPGDAGAAASLYRNVDAGRSAHAEYRCRHAAGHYVWIRDELAPVRDEQGRVVGSVGSFTDVTQRKTLEEQAEHHRAMLQQVIDSNPCVIFVKDRDGRFTLANRATASICGLRVEDMIGRTDTEVLRDPAEARRFREQDLSVFESGREIVVDEESVTNRAGHVRVLQTIKRPLTDDAGRVTHVLGVATDITDRRRMERELEEQQQLLRAIIEGASDFIFAKDLRGRYVLTNPAHVRLLGREIKGATDEDLFPQEQARRLRDIDRRVIDTRQSHTFEEAFAGAAGGQHSLLVSAFPRINAAGEVIGVLGIARDITDRKLAEQALQLSHAELERRIAERTSDLAETKAYLRHVLDTSPALIFEKDANLRIVFANREFLVRYGLTEEAVIGKRVGEFYANADDVASYERGDRAVFESGRKLVTIEHNEVGGIDTWFRVVKTPIRRADGAMHVLGMATDITDLVRAERELRDSLTRLELMARGASDGLWDATILPDLPWHSPDTPVYFSPRFKHLLGYSENEFPDRLQSWADLLHPEDKPRVMQALADHLERRLPYEIEYRLRVRSGEYRWFIARGQAIWDAAGRPLRMAGSLNDITHRKEAEDRLRRQAQVFDNMYDGVLLTDAENRIIGWNRGAERIFGYGEAEMIGASPEVLNPPDAAQFITRGIHESIERLGRWSGLVPIIRKDGATGICEVVCVPMTDSRGSIIGTVSVNRDVSERIANERERQKLEHQLRQSQKMEAIGTLASGIAHDFGNLLAAIFTYADLAKSSLPRNHAAIRTLEKLEQTARDARDVTNSLLTFTHRGVTQKSPQNLCRIVRESLTLLSRLVPARIRLHQDLPADDVWIIADPGQLQQVLMNLVFNARDAMPNGGRVTVSVEVRDPQPGAADRADRGRHVALCVRDEGCGMSETERGRIFEPFFTTKLRGQGSGLGLSIVMSIVEDMRGTIDVESAPSAGTCFTVRLPTCDAPPAQVEADATRPATDTLVVVIEPNRHVRSIITTTLRTHGHDVAAFGAIGDALPRIQSAEGRRLILVVDLDFGADNSADLEAGLRLLPRSIPLIAMAGTLSINLQRYGLERCYLLRKPFQMVELANTVQRLLRDAPAGHEEARP